MPSATAEAKSAADALAKAQAALDAAGAARATLEGKLSAQRPGSRGYELLRSQTDAALKAEATARAALAAAQDRLASATRALADLNAAIEAEKVAIARLLPSTAAPSSPTATPSTPSATPSSPTATSSTPSATPSTPSATSPARPRIDAGSLRAARKAGGALLRRVADPASSPGAALPPEASPDRLSAVVAGLGPKAARGALEAELSDASERAQLGAFLDWGAAGDPGDFEALLDHLAAPDDQAARWLGRLSGRDSAAEALAALDPGFVTGLQGSLAAAPDLATLANLSAAQPGALASVLGAAEAAHAIGGEALAVLDEVRRILSLQSKDCVESLARLGGQTREPDGLRFVAAALSLFPGSEAALDNLAATAGGFEALGVPRTGWCNVPEGVVHIDERGVVDGPGAGEFRVGPVKVHALPVTRAMDAVLRGWRGGEGDLRAACMDLDAEDVQQICQRWSALPGLSRVGPLREVEWALAAQGGPGGSAPPPRSPVLPTPGVDAVLRLDSPNSAGLIGLSDAILERVVQPVGGGDQSAWRYGPGHRGGQDPLRGIGALRVRELPPAVVLSGGGGATAEEGGGSGGVLPPDDPTRGAGSRGHVVPIHPAPRLEQDPVGQPVQAGAVERVTMLSGGAPPTESCIGHGPTVPIAGAPNPQLAMPAEGPPAREVPEICPPCDACSPVCDPTPEEKSLEEQIKEILKKLKEADDKAEKGRLKEKLKQLKKAVEQAKKQLREREKAGSKKKAKVAERIDKERESIEKERETVDAARDDLARRQREAADKEAELREQHRRIKQMDPNCASASCRSLHAELSALNQQKVGLQKESAGLDAQDRALGQRQRDLGAAVDQFEDLERRGWGMSSEDRRQAREMEQIAALGRNVAFFEGEAERLQRKAREQGGLSPLDEAALREAERLAGEGRRKLDGGYDPAHMEDLYRERAALRKAGAKPGTPEAHRQKEIEREIDRMNKAYGESLAGRQELERVERTQGSAARQTLYEALHSSRRQWGLGAEEQGAWLAEAYAVRDEAARAIGVLGLDDAQIEAWIANAGLAIGSLQDTMDRVGKAGSSAKDGATLGEWRGEAAELGARIDAALARREEARAERARFDAGLWERRAALEAVRREIFGLGASGDPARLAELRTREGALAAGLAADEVTLREYDAQIQALDGDYGRLSRERLVRDPLTDAAWEAGAVDDRNAALTEYFQPSGAVRADLGPAIQEQIRLAQRLGNLERRDALLRFGNRESAELTDEERQVAAALEAARAEAAERGWVADETGHMHPLSLLARATVQGFQERAAARDSRREALAKKSANIDEQLRAVAALAGLDSLGLKPLTGIHAVDQLFAVVQVASASAGAALRAALAGKVVDAEQEALIQALLPLAARGGLDAILQGIHRFRPASGAVGAVDGMVGLIEEARAVMRETGDLSSLVALDLALVEADQQHWDKLGESPFLERYAEDALRSYTALAQALGERGDLAGQAIAEAHAEVMAALLAGARGEETDSRALLASVLPRLEHEAWVAGLEGGTAGAVQGHQRTLGVLGLLVRQGEAADGDLGTTYAALGRTQLHLGAAIDGWIAEQRAAGGGDAALEAALAYHAQGALQARIYAAENLLRGGRPSEAAAALATLHPTEPVVQAQHINAYAALLRSQAEAMRTLVPDSRAWRDTRDAIEAGLLGMGGAVDAVSDAPIREVADEVLAAMELDIGRSFLEAGDEAQALARFTSALARAPRRATAVAMLGAIVAMPGELDIETIFSTMGKVYTAARRNIRDLEVEAAVLSSLDKAFTPVAEMGALRDIRELKVVAAVLSGMGKALTPVAEMGALRDSLNLGPVLPLLDLPFTVRGAPARTDTASPRAFEDVTLAALLTHADRVDWARVEEAAQGLPLAQWQSWTAWAKAAQLRADLDLNRVDGSQIAPTIDLIRGLMEGSGLSLASRHALDALLLGMDVDQAAAARPEPDEAEAWALDQWLAKARAAVSIGDTVQFEVAAGAIRDHALVDSDLEAVREHRDALVAMDLLGIRLAARVRPARAEGEAGWSPPSLLMGAISRERQLQVEADGAAALGQLPGYGERTVVLAELRSMVRVLEDWSAAPEGMGLDEEGVRVLGQYKLGIEEDIAKLAAEAEGAVRTLVAATPLNGNTPTPWSEQQGAMSRMDWMGGERLGTLAIQTMNLTQDRVAARLSELSPGTHLAWLDAELAYARSRRASAEVLLRGGDALNERDKALFPEIDFAQNGRSLSVEERAQLRAEAAAALAEEQVLEAWRVTTVGGAIPTQALLERLAEMQLGERGALAAVDGRGHGSAFGVGAELASDRLALTNLMAEWVIANARTLDHHADPNYDAWVESRWTKLRVDYLSADHSALGRERRDALAVLVRSNPARRAMDSFEGWVPPSGTDYAIEVQRRLQQHTSLPIEAYQDYVNTSIWDVGVGQSIDLHMNGDRYLRAISGFEEDQHRLLGQFAKAVEMVRLGQGGLVSSWAPAKQIAPFLGLHAEYGVGLPERGRLTETDGDIHSLLYDEIGLPQRTALDEIFNLREMTYQLVAALATAGVLSVASAGVRWGAKGALAAMRAGTTASLVQRGALGLARTGKWLGKSIPGRVVSEVGAELGAELVGMGMDAVLREGSARPTTLDQYLGLPTEPPLDPGFFSQLAEAGVGALVEVAAQGLVAAIPGLHSTAKFIQRPTMGSADWYRAAPGDALGLVLGSGLGSAAGALAVGRDASWEGALGAILSPAQLMGGMTHVGSKAFSRVRSRMVRDVVGGTPGRPTSASNQIPARTLPVATPQGVAAAPYRSAPEPRTPSGAAALRSDASPATAGRNTTPSASQPAVGGITIPSASQPAAARSFPAVPTVASPDARAELPSARPKGAEGHSSARTAQNPAPVPTASGLPAHPTATLSTPGAHQSPVAVLRSGRVPGMRALLRHLGDQRVAPTVTLRAPPTARPLGQVGLRLLQPLVVGSGLVASRTSRAQAVVRAGARVPAKTNQRSTARGQSPVGRPPRGAGPPRSSGPVAFANAPDPVSRRWDRIRSAPGPLLRERAIAVFRAIGATPRGARALEILREVGFDRAKLNARIGLPEDHPLALRPVDIDIVNGVRTELAYALLNAALEALGDSQGLPVRAFGPAGDGRTREGAIGGHRLRVLELGSKKPTSDLDFSVEGPFSGELVSLFNEISRALPGLQGLESGIPLDVNAYTRPFHQVWEVPATQGQPSRELRDALLHERMTLGPDAFTANMTERYDMLRAVDPALFPDARGRLANALALERAVNAEALRLEGELALVERGLRAAGETREDQLRFQARNELFGQSQRRVDTLDHQVRLLQALLHGEKLPDLPIELMELGASTELGAVTLPDVDLKALPEASPARESWLHTELDRLLHLGHRAQVEASLFAAEAHASRSAIEHVVGWIQGDQHVFDEAWVDAVRAGSRRVGEEGVYLLAPLAAALESATSRAHSLTRTASQAAIAKSGKYLARALDAARVAGLASGDALLSREELATLAAQQDPKAGTLRIRSLVAEDPNRTDQVLARHDAILTELQRRFWIQSPELAAQQTHVIDPADPALQGLPDLDILTRQTDPVVLLEALRIDAAGLRRMAEGLGGDGVRWILGASLDGADALRLGAALLERLGGRPDQLPKAQLLELIGAVRAPDALLLLRRELGAQALSLSRVLPVGALDRAITALLSIAETGTLDTLAEAIDADAASMARLLGLAPPALLARGLDMPGITPSLLLQAFELASEAERAQPERVLAALEGEAEPGLLLEAARVLGSLEGGRQERLKPRAPPDGQARSPVTELNSGGAAPRPGSPEDEKIAFERMLQNPEGARLRVEGPDGPVEIVLGAWLGAGAFNVVTTDPSSPGHVLRVLNVYGEGAVDNLRWENIGLEMLEQALRAAPDDVDAPARVASYAQVLPDKRLGRVERVEKIPDGCVEIVSDDPVKDPKRQVNQRRLSPGQVDALTRGVRALNALGILWFDCNRGNFRLRQLPGEDRWILYIVDPGGLAPVKGPNPAALARELQGRVFAPAESSASDAATVNPLAPYAAAQLAATDGIDRVALGLEADADIPASGLHAPFVDRRIREMFRAEDPAAKLAELRADWENPALRAPWKPE